METLQHPELIKARKHHICMFCCDGIIKGTNYLRSVHKHDGGVYTWKTHKHCNEIASKLGMYQDADEGVTTDYFIDSIKEEYDRLFGVRLKHIPFGELLIYVLNHHKILI